MEPVQALALQNLHALYHFANSHNLPSDFAEWISKTIDATSVPYNDKNVNMPFSEINVRYMQSYPGNVNEIIRAAHLLYANPATRVSFCVDSVEQVKQKFDLLVDGVTEQCKTTSTMSGGDFLIEHDWLLGEPERLAMLDVSEMKMYVHTLSGMKELIKLGQGSAPQYGGKRSIHMGQFYETGGTCAEVHPDIVDVLHTRLRMRAA